jgi:hypothetical protein
VTAAQSIIGYVPDSLAKGMHEGRGLGGDVLELPLEPGKGAAMVRVRHADIHEVRMGPSQGGHTGLQIVLKPDAHYEIVAASLSESESFTAIADPAFWYGLGRLRWFVIYAGPIFRQIENGGFRAVAQQ